MRMESAKMVLMNLLEGQQWRGRHREQICRQCGREKLGRTERVEWKHTIPTTIKVHSNSSLPPKSPLCFPLIVMTESHSNTWQLQNLLSEISVLFLRILCKWTHIKGNL